MTVLSTTAYTQSNTQQIKDSIRNPCFVQELDYGTYYDGYRVLTEKSLDTIIIKLDAILNCKDIQLCREKGLASDSWHTLMRIQDIEWTTHKTDIISYLKNWLKQILSGNSYLKGNNKNIFYDKNGCPYTNGHPISLPPSCYGVIMKLDIKDGVKIIEENWTLISKDEPFENRLRGGILNLLNIYYKSPYVQSLLKKLEKTKIPDNEIIKIQEIKFKYELSQSKSQMEAWGKLILQNKAKLSKSLFDENKQIWEKNIGKLQQLFGYKLEVKAPLESAEKEKDLAVKYWLAYSTCYIENGNYPNKSDEAIVKRIHKLVSNIQSQNLSKEINMNIDYLNEAYQLFKKWH